MKNPLLLATTLISLITPVSVHAGTGVAQRFVVTGPSSSAAADELPGLGGTKVRDLTYNSGFVAHMSATAAARLAELFGSDVTIEEDGVVNVLGKPSTGGTSSPPETVPWGISAIRATDASALNRGSGAVVCVVDTGVQKDHPDLAANIVGGENFVVSRGTVDATKYDDDNGHGTHVSGTIAAVDNTIGAIGVAPDAKIFAAKVLDRRGSGYLSDVADGVLSCVANGAHVINLSLGGSSDSTVLHDAIQTAAAAGLTIVAAAGNDGSAVSYPARYAEVLAVSAVDSSLALAYFSNFGPEIAFAAPGVHVYSTVKGGSYAYYDGTSMASPHVAGVAALRVSSGSLGLLSTDIGLSSDQQGAGLIDALLTVQNTAAP